MENKLLDISDLTIAYHSKKARLLEIVWPSGVVQRLEVIAADQIITVNERGTEAVLNARALGFLGPDFVNAVNSGLSNAHDIARSLPSSLTRPITSDAAGFQQLQAQGAAARSAAGGGTTVQGHKLTAVFPRNNQEFREFMQSADGERMIVDTVKRRRVDIGINT